MSNDFNRVRLSLVHDRTVLISDVDKRFFLVRILKQAKETSQTSPELKQQISVISEDWDKVFDNLDRSDGTNDGKINRP